MTAKKTKLPTQAVLIHGPQGCGKTTFAELFKIMFDLRDICDEFFPLHDTVYQDDTLYLTLYEPTPTPPNVRVFSFERAKTMLDEEHAFGNDKIADKLRAYTTPATAPAGPTGPTGSVMPLLGALGANPKDAVGSAKAGTSYIPMPPLYEVGLAMMEGAIKYGPFNWRDSAVDNRIYVDAAKRHIDRYWNGQNRDPSTKTHELGLAIAGLLVLLDAEMCGKLIDSRPTAMPDGWIEAMEERVKLVKTFAEGERDKRLAKQKKPQE